MCLFPHLHFATLPLSHFFAPPSFPHPIGSSPKRSWAALPSEFNGQKLLADSSVQSLNLSKLYSGGDFNLSSGQLDIADAYVNSAIKSIAEGRAAVGNRDRDLESQSRTLNSELEAITGIKSSLKDTDYAKETSELVRAQLLQQAATYVIKFARQTKADTMLAVLNGVKS